jgi:hypothetical protein
MHEVVDGYADLLAEAFERRPRVLKLRCGDRFPESGVIGQRTLNM